MDAVAQTLRATSEASAYAFPLAFAAGAVTSIGPCVAPRFIAVAGLTCNRKVKSALALAGAFVGGLCAAYALFGAVAALLQHVVRFSSTVYAFIALSLFVAALVQLWTDQPVDHVHEVTRPTTTAGAAFLAGISFALVVSPCCTPLVAGIIAYTSMAGKPLYGSAVLACFAVGHSLPVFAVAMGARECGLFFDRLAVRSAAKVLSAGLMLTLAVYYSVLS